MIAIRTDANGTIAMGHLMRCMVIAKQLRKLNQAVIFIISENYSQKYIEDNGFECICLNNNYNEKETEIDAVREIIQKYNIGKLLVDSYEVTHKYLTQLKEIVYLIYIDDMNAFKYPVDMLINYSYNTDFSRYRYQHYDISKVKMLLGSDYVPLREEFAGPAIEVKKRAESLFITTGGTDEFDMIIRIIQAVNHSECRDMKKYVVAGKFYKHMDRLKELQREDKLIEIYRDIPNIYDIMRKGDIAISAGGTTLAELCSCGIPTICFIIADNQIMGVQEYSKSGFMFYVGDIRDEKNNIKHNNESNSTEYRIASHVCKLRNQYIVRYNMAYEAKKAIDGKGAARIAEAINEIACKDTN